MADVSTNGDAPAPAAATPLADVTAHRSVALVLDFGSQYTQLIARRVREMGVCSVSLPGTATLDEIKATHASLIILSGGPESVHEEGAPTVPKGFFDYCAGRETDSAGAASGKQVTVLGICYGMQLIVHELGGVVERADKHEYGRMAIDIDPKSRLFKGAAGGGGSEGDHSSSGDGDGAADGFTATQVRARRALECRRGGKG